MRVFVFFIASFCGVALVCAQSESGIASVQQALKDQGFYYGEANGRKDGDTTAAIRRYQIRNGLQITGDLNAETVKALGVKGVALPPPRATPAATPRVIPAPTDRVQTPVATPTPRPAFLPDVRQPNSEMATVFFGTAYQNAPLELQRQVMATAQNLLARRGYYHDLIDGEFGPATEFAIRAFQSRFAIPVDGRLGQRTLGALGLLPRQKAPGLTAPSSRGSTRSTTLSPNGEPVYEPR